MVIKEGDNMDYKQKADKLCETLEKEEFRVLLSSDDADNEPFSLSMDISKLGLVIYPMLHNGVNLEYMYFEIQDWNEKTLKRYKRICDVVKFVKNFKISDVN